MPTDVALTTKDNPFNPFTEFVQWLSYDHFLGYNTSELLARVDFGCSELPESMQQEITEEAIKELVLTDPYDNMIMVTRDNVDEVLKQYKKD